MASRLYEREKSLRINNEHLQETHNQLKMQQIHLVQAQKMAAVGQLSAGLAHELNTPLGYIGTNIRVLCEYTSDLLQLIETSEREMRACHDADGTTLAEALSAIATQSDAIGLDSLRVDIKEVAAESSEGLERMTGILRYLRDFAHEDDAQKEWHNLEQSIDVTIAIARLSFQTPCTIEKQYGVVPPIYCYPQEINQAIMALIQNANQALDRSGEITISTYREEEFTCVRITDNGIGMSEEVRARACEPFFTTHAIGQSKGMGLSTVYHIIVERHQGDLQVDSQPGQGTVVLLKIPQRPENKERIGNDGNAS